MARIAVTHAGSLPCVTVRGHLSAADLRRLERACGPALERKVIDIELCLTGVATMDAAARAFVQRLVDRGARLVDSCGDQMRAP